MRENYLKLGVIILALLEPIIIIMVFGTNFKSFSKCWGSCLEPIFILTNASTSFFLYNIKRWRIPAIFLMLLTVFSTDCYSTLHNLFATIFFISVFYSLAEFHTLRGFMYIYCFSIVIGAKFGIFWFEVWTSYTICFYHLYVLCIALKFKNRNTI